MIVLIQNIWGMVIHPDRTLESIREESPGQSILTLAILSGWLSIHNAVGNLLEFPCNLLNSGTNPQLFAYHDITPLLMERYGGERWIWMIPLVFLLSMAFVPLVSLFYHLIFKLLKGNGGYWQTFRVFLYEGVPVFLMGGIPLIGGTLAAFWTAALIPLALVKLHGFAWGKAAVFAGALMGLQMGRIFLTGEWYGIPVR